MRKKRYEVGLEDLTKSVTSLAKLVLAHVSEKRPAEEDSALEERIVKLSEQLASHIEGGLRDPTLEGKYEMAAVESGMERRDRFAMAALIGLLSKGDHPRDAVPDTYEIADEMLRIRDE